MLRSVFWTLINIFIGGSVASIWLDCHWLTFIWVVLQISLLLNCDRFLIYLMNARIIKNLPERWEVLLSSRFNFLQADRCHYNPETQVFYFSVNRKTIVVHQNEQLYLVCFAVIQNFIRWIPSNFLRYFFLPLSVFIYYYQIMAKFYLVSADLSEDLPSLLLNRDILMILRV